MDSGKKNLVTDARMQGLSRSVGPREGFISFDSIQNNSANLIQDLDVCPYAA
jgi:hypothetical protein